MSSAKVGALLGSFQDKRYKVRREALFETAKYASKGEFNKNVLVFLTKFLSDEDKAARSTAAWTIGKYAQNKL
ncbi:MAG: HEAT repeat domain-containing protein, partial [Candidatus Freyarchaeota archaeon]